MRAKRYTISAFKSDYPKRRWVSSLWTARMAAATFVAMMPPGLAQQNTPVHTRQAPSPSEQASHNNRVVLMLVRSTLLAIADANETGNYTVLRDLGAPSFQAANTAARLSEVFSTLRVQRLDLSQVAVLEPQLTIPAQRDNKGLLRIEGTFPATPQISFFLLFEPVAEQWQLSTVLLSSGQPAPPSQPASLTDQAPGNSLGVLILIRSTLLALADANATGNYTVLRDLGAPSFRAANTSARLSEIFSNLRTQHLDLSPLIVSEPQLKTPPQLDAEGLLHIEGIFPSMTPQMTFSLVFASVAGRWRLFSVSLNPNQLAPHSRSTTVGRRQSAKPQGSRPAANATPASSKGGNAKER